MRILKHPRYPPRTQVIGTTFKLKLLSMPDMDLAFDVNAGRQVIGMPRASKTC